MSQTDEHLRLQFGARVRELREQMPSPRDGQAHMSQDDFALHAGVHRTWISALERGERAPSLGSIVQLADALGITASELLDGIG